MSYIVYKHTCPNGKMYIGITSNIKRRWGAMGQEYHSCKNFYYAIRKYGWVNIKHEILHENLSKEDAEKLEIEYIKKYKTTDVRYGYNMTSGGSGVPNNSGYRRVNQYTLDGELVKTYNTITEATKALGVTNGVISNICRKRKGHKTIKGFIFRYEGDSLDLDLLIRSDCDSVYQMDESKNIIKEFYSIKAAAKEVRVDRSSITHAIKHHSKCKNYYWCKVEDYEDYIITPVVKKEFVATNKNDSILKIYNSVAEAAKDLNVNRSGIYACLSGKCKSSGGYGFKYVDQSIYENMEPRTRCAKIAVRCIETGVVYESIRQAVKLTGAKKVSEACSGKRKTSGGYHWEYV